MSAPKEMTIVPFRGHEYSANPISDSNDDSDSSVPKNFSGIDGDNEEEEEEKTD